MPRRIAAILNPISGRRNMLPVVELIRRGLERHGRFLDIQVTAGVGHATRIAAQLPEDVEAVLVVGGDGTVCEVVNGIIGRPIPMVILRTGTENLLAREFDMPTDPSEIARALIEGEQFSCDVGVVNDRHFMAVAGVGFDAECVGRLAKVRRGHITYGDYFWPIWRTFWGHKFPCIEVIADGERVFEGRGQVLIGVIGRYSAGLRILAEAKYDDGLLDLCVLQCASRTALLRHAANLFLRRHVGSPGVSYRQCRRITISSLDEVPIEIDGEAGGHLPATFSILPAAVKFLRAPAMG